jgi:hypothetical protein
MIFEIFPVEKEDHVGEYVNGVVANNQNSGFNYNLQIHAVYILFLH